jgi:trk system potassium uptake protein TrkA
MNVLIVGGGKIGRYLASLLHAAKHQVTVIELRQAHVAEVERLAPGVRVFTGSGADPDLLERAGVRQVQVVAAVTGSDEINLVVTSLARFEFRVARTIARVNDPRNAWLYTADMGVDVVVNQADVMSHLILEEMSLGDMMTLLKLRRGQYSLVEEKVHPQALAVGKAICELDLPRECVLAAILRGGQLLIPRGDTRLQAADEVLAVVHAEDAPRLAALLAPPIKP